MGVGEAVEQAVVVWNRAAEGVDEARCVVPPQGRENRALGQFALKDGVLQPEPEQTLIGVALFLPLEGVKEAAQFWIFIMPMQRPDQQVPV